VQSENDSYGIKQLLIGKEEAEANILKACEKYDNIDELLNTQLSEKTTIDKRISNLESKANGSLDLVKETLEKEVELLEKELIKIGEIDTKQITKTSRTRSRWFFGLFL